jgi:hypothetical protein
MSMTHLWACNAAGYHVATRTSRPNSDSSSKRLEATASPPSSLGKWASRTPAWHYIVGVESPLCNKRGESLNTMLEMSTHPIDGQSPAQGASASDTCGGILQVITGNGVNPAFRMRRNAEAQSTCTLTGSSKEARYLRATGSRQNTIR